MSQRLALLAACTAAPDPETWQRAVTALGRWVQAGRPEAPAPKSRATGRNYYQTIWQITKSHVFTEAERAEYRHRAQWEHASEALYREVTTAAKERTKAEKQASAAPA